MVDDNSPDGTQEIAKQLARVYGEDKIVRFLKLYAFALSDMLSRYSNRVLVNSV